MLVEYPTTNYDTFSSLTDANTIIAKLVPDTALWDALEDTQKEIYLRQATLIIKNRIATLPATLENDLKTATAFLSNHSIGKSLADTSDKAYISEKEIVGVVRTKYASPRKSDDELPSLVVQLLKQYSVESSSSFNFDRA